MQYKHFIATRFNLRIGNWETTKNGETLLTDQWMEDRFKLFETYCLPSVLNQSNQNFLWCIFFDNNTKESDRDKIKKLTENFPIIKVLYIDGIDELRTGLISFIKKTPGDFEFAITTRLDTDDLLHKDFIKTVQKLFKPEHDAVIDIRTGYQVSIENGIGEVRNLNNNFNQFVSLIEETGKAETVFSKWHKHWENWKNVVTYDRKRLWIEMVHSKNYVNTAMPGLGYPLNFREADFGTEGKIQLKKNREFYSYFLKKGAHQCVHYLKRIIKQSVKFAVGSKQK